MSTVHVRVKTMEDKITEYVENHSEEIYVDYRDELSSEQVDKILEGKADEVRWEIEEQAYQWDNDLSYYWEQCREATGATQEDIEDWLSDGGFYPSYDLTDHDWKRLLSNTTVKVVGVVWDAEYNFYDWAYGGVVNYSDVKESLKILGVNPYEYRELKTGGSMSGGDQLKGWFPNMPDREAKIDTKELWENMCVLYNGVMHFCIGDLESLVDVTSSDSKNIVFKKGTNVVFYDRGNGAGITDVQLTGDVIIPRKKVEFINETNNSYGVQACYGFTNSYWESGEVQNVSGRK